MTTDVQQNGLYERGGPARHLRHATKCTAHLEGRHTGYPASIVLKIKHAGPDGSIEVAEMTLSRHQALSLAAALLDAGRKQ